ncbi:MAG TPA: hypothetical protein VNO82_19460 [Solirubrobacteraceae bacterium]|nr:hypothetical protein [Solirubrobacteraceae bacterium]
MSLLEESLRRIDPVDPDAPAVDGEELLREIVRTPVARAPRARRGRKRLALTAAVAVAAATGLVLVTPARDDVDVVAAAFDAVSGRDTILHYRVRHQSGEQVLLDAQVWQAGDGSRLRSLSRPMPMDSEPALESESVQTDEESRTYIAEDDAIIVYDSDVPRLPAPGGAAFADGALGDPRTLLERAQRGDEKVVELGEATVRGIPVLQFRVGRCEMTSRKTGSGSSMTYRFPVIASVAREDYTPVRLEQDTDCGFGLDGLPHVVADYLSFETLPATADNRRLLEMRPHPGARIVDGEDVDAAEERDERP